MLSSFSRFRNKFYNPLYPPLYPPAYSHSPLYSPAYSHSPLYSALYSPLYSPYKNNLKDYIRKIESDLKNKRIGYNNTKVDNNYGILPIVGIVFFLAGYYYGK